MNRYGSPSTQLNILHYIT